MKLMAMARHAARSSGVLAALAVLSAPSIASATARHFGFSQESSVEPAGSAELQPWTTVRAGRASYYSDLEARLGLDFGMAEHLEGAFFWQLSSVTEDITAPSAAAPARLSSTDLQSFSARLKYGLGDPVADAVGAALQLEGSYGPLLLGFEARVILDEQLGSLLLSANAFGGALGQLDRHTTFQGSAGATLAAAYFITPSVVPGLEARDETSFDSKIDSSVLHLGPSLSLLSGRYWATLAAEPQLVAFKGASPGHRLDLSHDERLQARLLFGFQL